MKLEARQQTGATQDPTKDPVLDYIEAYVVKEKVLKYRVNLLAGTTKQGTLANAEQALHMVRVANYYLRQVGIRLEADMDTTTSDGANAVSGMPGYFTATVDDKMVDGVVANGDLADQAAAINYRAKVVQINFIGTLSGSKEAGDTVANPGNSKGKELSMEYRITVDENPANHTMKLLPAQSVTGKTDLWGILISNQAGDPKDAYDQSIFGNTIAHEIGHLLCLAHREPPAGDPIPDGLNKPHNENLMDTGLTDMPPFGPTAEDLDLIQLIAMRASKAFD